MLHILTDNYLNFSKTFDGFSAIIHFCVFVTYGCDIYCQVVDTMNLDEMRSRTFRRTQPLSFPHTRWARVVDSAREQAFGFHGYVELACHGQEYIIFWVETSAWEIWSSSALGLCGIVGLCCSPLYESTPFFEGRKRRQKQPRNCGQSRKDFYFSFP